MSAVYPNEGLPILLDQLWRAAAAPVTPWQIFLWANNVVPDQATVAADITPASFTGYSPVNITRSTWVASVVSANHGVTTYGSTPILWTATGGFQIIYGYGIYEPVSNKLLLIERFATSINLAATPIIGVLPRTTDTTE